MKSASLLTGIILGGIAGATLGILLAPDKGAETRRKLTKKGMALADTLKEKYNDLIDEVIEDYEYAEDDIYQAGDQVASAVKSGKKKAQKAMDPEMK